MARTIQRLHHSPSRTTRATALSWVSLLAIAACATETSDPQNERATGGSTSGTAGSGGAAGAASGGKPAGGSTATGGTAGKAGAASTAGAAGTMAGMGGKPSGGAAGGGAGGATAGTSTGGSGAGTAGAGQGGGGAGGTSGAGGSAGGGSVCDEGIAFCDDFEDQNASGWTKSGGTWSVVADGGNWTYEGGNGSEEAYAGDTSWTDQTVQAKVKVINFGGTSDSYRAGIMARHSGGSSFYVFALGGDGNLTLRKSTSTPSGSSGTCGALAADIDAEDWFTLKMTVSGAASSVRIRTYVDDVLKHDCMTTSSTVANGRAGVLTYGSNTVARFDDVSVTTP
jgi:hypothetical protein